MATLHKSAGGAEMLLVKGAPEVILEHCDRQQMVGGQPAPLDRERFVQESDRLAAQGERVLGLAWLEDPGMKAGNLGPADLPKTLVLLGLVGLLDPPRKEAIEAVKECHGGSSSLRTGGTPMGPRPDRFPDRRPQLAERRAQLAVDLCARSTQRAVDHAGRGRRGAIDGKT